LREAAGSSGRQRTWFQLLFSDASRIIFMRFFYVSGRDHRAPANPILAKNRMGRDHTHLRCSHELLVARDCAESQSQRHHKLAVTPNLLRLVLRTQPRSGSPAKFTDNLWM
jgi:hypothetical protein